MSEQWSLPAWALGLAAVLVLLLAVAVVPLVVRDRRREARLDRAEADASALRSTLARVEARIEARLEASLGGTERADAPASEEDPLGPSDYVITWVGDPAPEVEHHPARRVVPAPLFADLVARESVVQAASLAAGVRRALSPETRHRIRFEMRREVKRARKQRRADLRSARRAWEADQRQAPAVPDRAPDHPVEHAAGHTGRTAGHGRQGRHGEGSAA